jgi:hypothetical protein
MSTTRNESVEHTARVPSALHKSIHRYLQQKSRSISSGVSVYRGRERDRDIVKIDSEGPEPCAPPATLTTAKTPVSSVGVHNERVTSLPLQKYEQSSSRQHSFKTAAAPAPAPAPALALAQGPVTVPSLNLDNLARSRINTRESCYHSFSKETMSANGSVHHNSQSDNESDTGQRRAVSGKRQDHWKLPPVPLVQVADYNDPAPRPRVLLHSTNLPSSPRSPVTAATYASSPRSPNSSYAERNSAKATIPRRSANTAAAVAAATGTTPAATTTTTRRRSSVLKSPRMQRSGVRSPQRHSQFNMFSYSLQNSLSSVKGGQMQHIFDHDGPADFVPVHKVGSPVSGGRTGAVASLYESVPSRPAAKSYSMASPANYANLKLHEHRGRRQLAKAFRTPKSPMMRSNDNQFDLLRLFELSNPDSFYCASKMYGSHKGDNDNDGDDNNNNGDNDDNDDDDDNGDNGEARYYANADHHNEDNCENPNFMPTWVDPDCANRYNDIDAARSFQLFEQMAFAFADRKVRNQFCALIDELRSVAFEQHTASFAQVLGPQPYARQVKSLESEVSDLNGQVWVMHEQINALHDKYMQRSLEKQTYLHLLKQVRLRAAVITEAQQVNTNLHTELIAQLQIAEEFLDHVSGQNAKLDVLQGAYGQAAKQSSMRLHNIAMLESSSIPSSNSSSRASSAATRSGSISAASCTSLDTSLPVGLTLADAEKQLEKAIKMSNSVEAKLEVEHAKTRQAEADLRSAVIGRNAMRTGIEVLEQAVSMMHSEVEEKFSAQSRFDYDDMEEPGQDVNSENGSNGAESQSRSASPSGQLGVPSGSRRRRSRRPLQPLGTQNHVPVFLRFDGWVPDLSFSKCEVELRVKEIWSRKSLHDQRLTQRGRPRSKLAEFFFKYAQSKSDGSIEDCMKFTYNFVEGLRRNLYDADLELFYKILFLQLDEAHYYDQMALMVFFKQMMQDWNAYCLDDSTRVPAECKPGFVPWQQFKKRMHEIFPIKSREHMNVLFQFARDDHLTDDGIDTAGVLSETASGDQTNLMEEIRDQYVSEVQLYHIKIRDALFGLATVSSPSGADDVKSSAASGLGKDTSDMAHVGTGLGDAGHLESDKMTTTKIPSLQYRKVLASVDSELTSYDVDVLVSRGYGAQNVSATHGIPIKTFHTNLMQGLLRNTRQWCRLNARVPSTQSE